MRPQILVVDDDPLTRELLTTCLDSEGYDTVCAEDGVVAKKRLEAEAERFDVVLLDRLMPRMDGIALLQWIKETPDLRDLPVIMQTAASREEEILEGIRAGAFYYLTKPIQIDILLSIVSAALGNQIRYRKLREDVLRHAVGLQRMAAGTFCIRTIEEAHNLAVTLALACPDAAARVIGLDELLINAVEHGNLEITYEEKKALLATGRLREEIRKRLNDPVLGARYAITRFRRAATHVEIEIEDKGRGFEWQSFLELSKDRVFESHGRGIALARRMSFDSVTYHGHGNIVVARIELENDDRFPPWCKDDQSEPGECPWGCPLHSERASGQAEDIRYAREMQLNLLPTPEARTSIEKTYDVAISAEYEASTLLGGDMWGLRTVDSHRFAMFIVDFSGHGFTAAINTFRLDTIMRRISAAFADPASCLAELNQRFVEILPVGQYATMLFGVVDATQGVFTYAAAGAPHPIIGDPKTGSVAIGNGQGVPLGITGAASYENRVMPFRPVGSVMFLYSDALFECGRETGSAIGRDGVNDLVIDAMKDGHMPPTAARIIEPFRARVPSPPR